MRPSRPGWPGKKPETYSLPLDVLSMKSLEVSWVFLGHPSRASGWPTPKTAPRRPVAHLTVSGPLTLQESR